MADPAADNKTFDEYYLQAALLAEVVKRLLKRKGDVELSSKPRFALKPITEFRRRIRISGLEKFNEKSYIGTVNFYRNLQDMDKEKAAGAIILYLAESYIVRLLRELHYPVIDEDDEEVIEDAVGTVCNLVAGNFKAGLTQLGYVDLEMSHFHTYQNEIFDGVPYDPEQKQLYEISFEIRGQVRMVADLAMGPLPKNEGQEKQEEM